LEHNRDGKAASSLYDAGSESIVRRVRTAAGEAVKLNRRLRRLKKLRLVEIRAKVLRLMSERKSSDACVNRAVA
jgi:hypothetical protein